VRNAPVQWLVRLLGGEGEARLKPVLAFAAGGVAAAALGIAALGSARAANE
jgi:hypothetical protein